jgi:lysophospholipid acyltransferase (LPLAT)-like uncharacterized protein
MGQSAKTAIKENTKQKVIGTLIGFVIRLFGCTLRVHVDGGEHILSASKPVIIVFWHRNIMPATITWAKKMQNNRNVVTLTSASNDGALIEYAMKTFGIQSVRGSSSRRGALAIMELKSAIEHSSDICITPDGPRGPSEKLQLGVLKLAQLTGAPIISWHVKCSASWKLKTWDKFELPKPFSSLHITINEPVFVSRRVEADALEELKLSIEKQLS